jgi:ribosome-associated toxin RatA of RatAB toxin-antitoxin module
MIKKTAQIDSPKEEVIPIIWAFETWPDWLSKVRKASVINRDEKQALVDLTFSSFVTIHTRLLFQRQDSDTIVFKQVKGWFKEFSGQWKIVKAPQKDGTQLSITSKLEVGLLIPKKLVHCHIGDFFDDFPIALHNKAKLFKMPKDLEAAEKVEEARKILQVSKTGKGLEIWFLGKRYQLKEM